MSGTNGAAYQLRFAHGLDNDRITRTLTMTAAFALALFIVTLPAWLTDTRQIAGESVWLKPQKFNLSFIVHFLTIAILAQQVPRAIRTGVTLTIFTYAAVASMAVEQIYMSVQAARARASHYNFDTDIEALMYASMGIGALLLVFLPIALSVQIARRGQHERSGYRLGSILGLSIGAITTIGFAGYMSMSSSHSVGIHPVGGAQIPFFGWSREVGDLRPAHFVAMHTMQTLPIIGILVDRVGGPSRMVVMGAALLQAGLAAGLFFLGLSGQPFWPA